jgi:hypothetical protein
MKICHHCVMEGLKLWANFYSKERFMNGSLAFRLPLLVGRSLYR